MSCEYVRMYIRICTYIPYILHIYGYGTDGLSLIKHKLLGENIHMYISGQF